MQSTPKALTTVYIGPTSPQQLRDVAGYTLADGSTPAVDVVCLFAAAYAASTPPYLRANNDDPPTSKPFNPNLQKALDDGAVGYLQSKGLKVVMAVLNGHHPVGWSELATEDEAIKLATYLKTDVVDKYGLDGIDIDDEYSADQDKNGPAAGLPESLIMVTTKMRELMPGKLITKALWSDIQFFNASWKGNTLAANLNHGAEMTYGDPPEARLNPYLGAGMSKNKLSLGFWAERPSTNPEKDIAYLKANGFAGFSVFGFEAQSNVDLMGRLVNSWYGPGNWNPPASSPRS